MTQTLPNDGLLKAARIVAIVFQFLLGVGFFALLVAIPIVAIAMPVDKAIPLMLAPGYVMNLLQVRQTWHARTSLLPWWPAIAGMVIGVVVGVQIATSAPDQLVKGVLGTLVVAVDQRWAARDLVVGLASAVVPYATVPFERSAERRGLLGDRWRLLQAGAPAGPAGRLVAAGLRRPVLAVLVGLVAVVGVFVLLLALGPPTQWFAGPEPLRPPAAV